MQARLQHMPIEELSYLLAEHDKFIRVTCAEYADDHMNTKPLTDPLGRIVNPWGRLLDI